MAVKTIRWSWTARVSPLPRGVFHGPSDGAASSKVTYWVMQTTSVWHRTSGMNPVFHTVLYNMLYNKFAVAGVHGCCLLPIEGMNGASRSARLAEKVYYRFSSASALAKRSFFVTELRTIASLFLHLVQQHLLLAYSAVLCGLRIFFDRIPCLWLVWRNLCKVMTR